MILRPRRCNEASREIFSEDSASPVRGSHRKKCADSKKRAASTECFGSTSISRTLSPPPQEHSEVESQRCKSSTSGRPLILFERSFSRCSNPSIGEKDQLKTLKTLSINDITSSAKLANPIVLMDRYEPPERSSATKSIRLNNSNDTLEQQTKLEQTSEDPSKETGAPKTPDTATASDTSTPPRHEKKQSTGKMRGCSDDGSSYEALPEEEKWTEEERQPITVKDASKTKTKSHNPTESQSSTCLPTGKKRKLSGRQTSKRSHLTADELKQESDSSKVVSQGHKRSSALPSKSYDSCGGTTAPKRKSKKCKMEEERGIDYYASLLWISDNISEHRKLHENWSIEELEASLRLRWNSLKKKEKAEYSARIQRIPHLPHLPRLSATLREINNSGKGSAQTQDSGHEGHSMNSQDSGREMKSNYRVGMTLDDGTFPHQRQLSWKLGERVPPPQEKKKEFNLKTLFASPGVVKKQIIKLIRQRISCSHCFLNLRQFLVSKLDESWERCITKGLHPPPHVPLCSFAGADVCPGSHLKDSFEPSLMPVSMSGRNSGMAEEKRRLKRFWSGRVWTLMEDLLEMMEAEMSKRKTCSCKFKMNKFKSKTYRGSAAEVEASADLQTDAGPLDDNDMEKDEVEVAMEILESWTKEGREKRLQNDAKLLEISVADERVIEEIKCSLMEFSDMVTRDKNLLEDNTLSLAAPDDDLRTHAFAHYADGDIRRASNSTKFQRKDPLRGHHGQAFGGCHDNFGRRMLSNRWDGFLGNDQGLPCGPGGFGDSPEKEVELMGASGKELDGVEMFPRQNVEFDSPDMHCRQYKPRYQLQFSRNMFSSKSPRCPNNINSNMNQDNNSNNNIDNNNNNNNHNSSNNNNNSNNDDNNNDNDNNSNNNWLHTNSNMNQNNNNLFLDSFWGLSQRPNLVLPSAISTRPSPVFLTLKPPPLPPMPPLPPTPPPSSGSGFYQNDGEYRSGKMDPDFTGDILANIMKEKSFSQNEQNFGIKQNQFFLKLSMKNSQS